MYKQYVLKALRKLTSGKVAPASFSFFVVGCVSFRLLGCLNIATHMFCIFLISTALVTDPVLFSN
jgi:hypothetical protein